MHVGVSVRPREHALEADAAACLKYIPNCWGGGGFGHNAGVSGPEASIGSGPGSQGDLLVWGLQRGRGADIKPRDFCVNPCRGQLRCAVTQERFEESLM